MTDQRQWDERADCKGACSQPWRHTEYSSRPNEGGFGKLERKVRMMMMMMTVMLSGREKSICVDTRNASEADLSVLGSAIYLTGKAATKRVDEYRGGTKHARFFPPPSTACDRKISMSVQCIFAIRSRTSSRTCSVRNVDTTRRQFFTH